MKTIKATETALPRWFAHIMLATHPNSLGRSRVLGRLLLFSVFLFAGAAWARDQSDLNKDGTVNLDDLKLFSLKITGQDWQTIDWCQWIVANPDYEKRYTALYAFIPSCFNCSAPPPPDPLAVVNKLTYPTRLAWDSTGNLYVTDAKVGSVFIYDTNAVLSGELKGLDKPLGILVDTSGRIYVGNNGRHNVEVYSPQGALVAGLGTDILAMPNSLALDRATNLYVADSIGNRVCVFGANGNWTLNIGEGTLGFPAAVAIHYRPDATTGQDIGELYVADQTNYVVRVFDFQGGLLRSFGGQGTTGGMLGNKFYWQGKFARVSGLAFAADGNLHAVDSYYCNVQVLNPLSGAYISCYGSQGTAAGQLLVPLDVAINAQGRRAVANTLNDRIEIFQP